MFNYRYILAVSGNCLFVTYESYKEMAIVIFNDNIQLFANCEGGHFVINSEWNREVKHCINNKLHW
jgi:hypothetical protein